MADENAADQKAPETAETTAAETKVAETKTETPENAVETEKAPEAKPDAKGKKDDWRASIEDAKLRDHAGRFASPADLARAHRDLRDQLAKAPPSRPGKDAKPEELAAYLKKVGVPDEYTWTPAEGQKFSDAEVALQKKAGERFKAAELTAAQQKAVEGLWNEIRAETVAEATRAAIASYDAAETALRKEWGADFDANANIANAAFTKYGKLAGIDVESVVGMKLEDGRELRAVPEMMRIFAAVGRMTMETTGIVGLDSNEKSGLLEQHREAVAKSSDANAKGDLITAKREFERSQELAKKLWGHAA